jgi:intracellular septation protein
MQVLLYDFIVIFLFFIAFKFYGIYVATLVGIAGSVLQVLLTRIWQKKFDKKQLLVLSIFLVFGGLTLYFHDPIFVKWKPTIVFWIFGIAFFISHFFGKKPLIQRMMSSVIEDKYSIPKGVWKKLNFAWTVFFITLGAINISVAYHFTTDTWVNFKLYGIFSAMLLFGFGQALFLSRYLTEHPAK